MENSYYKSLEPFWGSWYLTEEIGKGSFGRVFIAERNDMGGSFKSAIKIVSIPQSEDEWNSAMAEGLDEQSTTTYYKGVVNELINEIKLMSRLKGNTNIVSYEDHMVLERANGHGWDIIIRMELLTPLVKFLNAKGSLTRDMVIKLGCDICRALEYCEGEHVIHRDIKFQNIFVTDTGDFKLGDFGIARTVEKSTDSMSMKGAPSTMAPEVYKRQPYGLTADIYSLGLVLYRLLNRNRGPFEPPYPQDLTFDGKERAFGCRMNGEQMSLPCDAQDQLGKVVLKACAYMPENRYQSAREMRKALESCIRFDDDSTVVDDDSDVTVVDESEMSYGSGNTPGFGYRTNSGSKPIQQQKTKINTIDFVILAICFVAGIIAAVVLTKVIGGHAKPDVTTMSTVTRKEEPYVSANEGLSDKAPIRIGDTIEFGAYEQDGNTENGKEPIEWIVLKKSEGEMLLLSRYILDTHSYDEEGKDVTWENSELRSWLNNDFYTTAFSDEDQDRIKSMSITNPDNPFYDSEGGEDTEDNVFCLSVEEVIRYFDFSSWYDDDQYGYCQALMAEATQYAKDNGAYTYTITGEDYDDILAPEGYDDSCIDQEYGWWWLRSPGMDGKNVSDVSDYGSAGWGSRYVEAEMSHGVRPALYLKADETEEVVSLEEARIGDTVSFGNFEQDADNKNGKEAIYWTVIDEKDDKMLLISNKILNYRQWNDTQDLVTWESCTTRKWLNEDFYNDAFSEEEKAIIVDTELDNPSSYDFYQTSYMSERWTWWKDGDIQGCSGGPDTVDKLFLLSYEEALKYYTDEDRLAGATACAVEQGIYVMRVDDYEKDYSTQYYERSIGKTAWWLRSPAWDEEHAMRVDYDGRLNAARTSIDWFGIRPAMWIKKQ